MSEALSSKTDVADPRAESAEPKAHRCRNCGAELAGRFCSKCGQDSTEGAPSLTEWCRESFEEFTSFDGRIWRSLRTLIGHPGGLTTAWVEGRRQGFTRPLRLFLLAVLLLVVSSAIWPAEGGFLAGFLAGALSDGTEPNAGAEKAAAFLYRTIQWFGLAMVPVAAGILACFYWRRPFAVHLVTGLHIFAFTLLAYVAALQVLGLAQMLGASIWMNPLVGGLLAVVVLRYAYSALLTIYGGSGTVTLLKTIGIVAVTLITWIAGAVLWTIGYST